MQATRREILTLENAKIGYANRELFTVPRLSFRSREWVAFLGSNGAGKTTLLRILAGILPLRTGTRSAAYACAGYVPQRYVASRDSLLTAAEFLRLQPRATEPLCSPKSAELLVRLGVASLLREPLRNLSGGQMQRVLLAFALLGAPEVLFLDEFLEGIDAATRFEVLNVLAEQSRERDVSILEVSHDLAGVIQHADRVIVIERGVVFDGSPRDPDLDRSLRAIYEERSAS